MTSRPMGRRRALGLLASAAGGGAAIATPAIAQNAVVTWRMATSWPAGLPVLADSAQAFARNVALATAGRLRIEVVDPSVHKAAGGIYDLVRSGAYEVGHTTAHYYKDKAPAFDFFTATPFGFTASENYAWLYGADGLALMGEVFRPHGIVALPAGNTGAQMGGWFRKEISSLDDIKGVRMRISGQPGQVWARLGGIPVSLPSGAIPKAFSDGQIDAAEFVGPAIDLALKLETFADHYYGTWHEPSVELHAFIDASRFDALPGDLQAGVRIAAQAAALETLSLSIARNAAAWQLVKANPAIKVRTFPPQVMAAMKAANAEVLAEITARDADARRVVASQNAFRALTRSYFAVTELAAIGGTSCG